MQASTVQLNKAIANKCTACLMSNPNNEWAIIIKAQIENCFEHVAAHARYHLTCRLLFKTERPSFASMKQNLKKEERLTATIWTAFGMHVRLGNESNVHSMKVFQINVQEYLWEGSAYTLKYLKKLLINNFREHVMFLMKNENKNWYI